MKVKLPLVAVGLAAACSAALATEYGTVISSTAVTAQAAMPQQQCTDGQALVQPRTSGGGALLGALVGGVVGNNLGAGMGRAAATGLGVVAGSVIGDRTEAANTPPAAVPARSCQTVTGYQNRVVGYDVVYEYNGQRDSARMAQDPGARIALDVNVAPTSDTVTVAPVPTAVDAPAPVYGPYTSYAYGPDGYYGYAGPAVAVVPSITLGFGGYWRHAYGR
jgi:uncharacterized protein YcfJ